MIVDGVRALLANNTAILKQYQGTSAPRTPNPTETGRNTSAKHTMRPSACYGEPRKSKRNVPPPGG